MAEAKTKHLSVSDLNKALPAEVAAKFKVVNAGKRTSTKFYHPKWGSINLKTIHIKRVEQLVALKCPYFAPVKETK